MTSQVIVLTPLDLSVAAGLVLLLGLLTWKLRLGITRNLYIAGLRTVVQLLLLGLILDYLFKVSHPVIILILAVLMVLIAGHEVMLRQKRAFKGSWGYALGTFSMFVSSFTITIFSLTVIVGPDPWYQPQYAIPILGMMLGNTMTGVALTLDYLTNHAWQQRSMIETRLLLGHTWQQAVRPLVRDSVRTGLIPIINSMAAAGIISIPGMMTGQVLAGNNPMNAAQYQILIMFMITAGTGFSAVIASWMGAKHLFDDRQRLRLDRLKQIK